MAKKKYKEGFKFSECISLLIITKNAPESFVKKMEEYNCDAKIIQK